MPAEPHNPSLGKKWEDQKRLSDSGLVGIAKAGGDGGDDDGVDGDDDDDDDVDPW